MSGVQKLRNARRSPSKLPAMKNPTHAGRYTGAPKIADPAWHPSPTKPGTFAKYDDVPMTKPKASDRMVGVGPVNTKQGAKGKH